VRDDLLELGGSAAAGKSKDEDHGQQTQNAVHDSIASALPWKLYCRPSVVSCRTDL
jgi:hypothetical protein